VRTAHAIDGQSHRAFGTLSYAAKTWDRRRRVIVKVEHLRGGEDGKSNPRYVVTNLAGDARTLYEQTYCARGDSENRIKEQQLGLFADRTRGVRVGGPSTAVAAEDRKFVTSKQPEIRHPAARGRGAVRPPLTQARDRAKRSPANRTAAEPKKTDEISGRTRDELVDFVRDWSTKIRHPRRSRSSPGSASAPASTTTGSTASARSTNTTPRSRVTTDDEKETIHSKAMEEPSSVFHCSSPAQNPFWAIPD